MRGNDTRTVGIVIGTAFHRNSRGKMEEKDSVCMTVESGIEGDVRGAGGQNRERQVTAVFWHEWTMACCEIGKELPWTSRRANLFLGFFGKPAGQWLLGRRITFPHGNEEDGGVMLEITGELKPCARMDEVYPGLQGALARDWRGGVACRVVRGGTVSYGDLFRIAEQPSLRVV